MGAGLQRAIDILVAAPPDPTRKRTILLLSDGYENSGSPRACSQTAPVDPCVGMGILPQLVANNIRVYAIALGAYAWFDCLECLATESGGEWYAPAGPGINLAQVYLDMQQAYSADDVYRADRGVSGGDDDTYTTFFEGLDDVLYFVLQWDRLNPNLGLDIRPPGEAWTSPEALGNTNVESGNGYVVVRVEKPDEGIWGYRVIGEPGEDYIVAVRSDRVGVQLHLDVMARGIVGEHIKIRARLTDRGLPVENADVRATVKVPSKRSFRTSLREASRKYLLEHKTFAVDPVALKEHPDLSRGAVLIQRLAQGRPEAWLETRSVDVPLKHEGDGYYSGVLKANTEIAGTYEITVEASGRKYDRVVSKYVRLHAAKMDPSKSFAEIIEMKAADGSPTWLVRSYPTDRFGNAVTAPSLAGRMKVGLKGAEPIKGAVLGLDGAFEQHLRVLPRQRPEAVIEMDEAKIKVRTPKRTEK
jgi:hypothetical protein